MKNIYLIFSTIFVGLILSYSLFSDASITNLFEENSTTTQKILKPEQAFKFNYLQDRNKLNINIQIEEGYYLYKDKVMVLSQDATPLDVELPSGIKHKDEFFGVREIYTSDLDLNLDLQKIEKGSVVTVQYQGCKAKTICFFPIKKQIELN